MYLTGVTTLQAFHTPDTGTMASCLDVKKEPIQWSKCCLCQLKGIGKLQTPKDATYVPSNLSAGLAPTEFASVFDL